MLEEGLANVKSKRLCFRNSRNSIKQNLIWYVEKLQFIPIPIAVFPLP